MTGMEFLEECFTKWGFSDGDNIPAGAFDIRDEIVKRANARLEKNNQSVRLVTYDRPGLHNACMVHWDTDETNAFTLWEHMPEDLVNYLSEQVSVHFSCDVYFEEDENDS